MPKKKRPAPAPSTRLARWLRDLADSVNALSDAAAAFRRLLGEVAGLFLMVAGAIAAFFGASGL